MADHFTTRLQLPYPDLDDPADVPTDMQQLAERLDVLIPGSGAAGSVLNRVTVGDIGMAGQIRAGRQLTAADFTNLGLAVPLGLWNLSNLIDASGNNRALTNKGAVGFATGINGLANTAAQFTGSTAQVLYIADTGAADPFRIKTGSWGCWFKTAKRGTLQNVFSKAAASPAGGWWVGVTSANAIFGQVSLAGTDFTGAVGVTDVCDDRWHFAAVTYDGTALRVYVDSVMEVVLLASGAIFSTSGPLNVGSQYADAGTAGASSHYGRADEAFVTSDVLSEDQIRGLYCARLPHGYAVVPSSVKLSVTRRRRGGAFAVADFPTQPLRLYNFTGGSAADEGSNGVVLTGTNVTGGIAGPDGTPNAVYFAGTSNLAGTDAGLPQGLASRSYGCWFKTATYTAGGNMLAWGTVSTGDARIGMTATGVIFTASGSDQSIGPFVGDGQWHLAVAVEDNTALDGVRRKLYVDGRLATGSTVMNAIVLAGANRFRIGAASDGVIPLTGQVDGAFVTDVALTAAQVFALYAKGTQPLSPSPKNPGDHVEGWDAAAVYATFDTLDSHWQVDLGAAV